MKNKYKSPLKSNPLRNPGESVQNYLLDTLLEKIAFPLTVSTFLIILVLIEWLHWYLDTPRNPKVLTLMVLPILIFYFYKIWKGLKKVKKIKQGLKGEKAVGQYLELLRETGAKVLHDIPGDKFNLDHIVISKSGIYVIETKTLSKPEKGEAKITINDQHICANGNQLKRNPIPQVLAAASWLQSVLKESTGHDYKVHPVVVFPGWFIETQNNTKNANYWVLNPKALPVYINNNPQELSSEDVNMCNYHLSRYIRNNS